MPAGTALVLPAAFPIRFSSAPLDLVRLASPQLLQSPTKIGKINFRWLDQAGAHDLYGMKLPVQIFFPLVQKLIYQREVWCDIHDLPDKCLQERKVVR